MTRTRWKLINRYSHFVDSDWNDRYFLYYGNLSVLRYFVIGQGALVIRTVEITMQLGESGSFSSSPLQAFSDAITRAEGDSLLMKLC